MLRTFSLCWLLSLAACGYDTFQGERAFIAFRPSLSRPLAPWTPDAGVARGAEVVFTVVGVDSLGPPYVPSVPSLDDAGVVALLDGGLGFAHVRAVTTGTARISWHADGGEDWFHVRVGEPGSARLSDPLLFRELDRLITRGRSWEDVAQSVLLPPDTEAFFEAVLQDDAGSYLASAFGQVRAESPLDVSTVGFGVRVPPLDAGCAGEVRLYNGADDGGQTLGSTIVRVVPADEVRSVELAALDFSSEDAGAQYQPHVFLKATVRFDGGEPLWYAPVRWSFDPAFREVDQEGELGLSPRRPDALVLRWEGDAGAHDTEVHGTVGGATGTLRVRVLAASAPPPAADASADEPPPPGGCGCSIGDGGLAWLAGALLAVTRRGRLRRPRPPAGWTP